MSERLHCEACGGESLVTFLDLGKTPLANSFPASINEQETWYPLGLCRCSNCGLVQNIEIIPDELIYNDQYGFYSGGSESQRAYHKRGADLLLERYHDLAHRFTVEIACNDGTLLQHFVNAGCTSLGIDPARPAQVAIDAGLPVIKKPFTSELAREIREQNGPAGLVIAWNSLAHVADLADVLTGIWELLAVDGVAVVEVQYLPDLIAGNMIGQVYHEHRYFYSLTTFRHVAKIHNLHVIDAELIEYQNGGIRITLSRDASRPPTPRVGKIIAAEQWLSQEESFIGVQGRIDRMRDHLMDILWREFRVYRPVVGYAAAAKATTILNFCGITNKMIPFVLDATPYKEGRFIPGVKIPIISPGHFDTHGLIDDHDRLLLASNYLGSLLRNEPEFLAKGGRWIIMEPMPVII